VTRVSVIVPLHRRGPAFERCLAGIVREAGGQHEILVVSDADPGPLPTGVAALRTDAARDTSPAEKRDVAVGVAQGEVCAFIDDDAYPAAGWIERALARLDDPAVAGVGGPGLTPPDSGWRERASGAFYESRLGSGSLRFRFLPVGGARDLDDLPAYNLFVRTDALRAIGGWGSRLYGGEDTKVCLALVRAGYRLVYDPAVVVHHHRRPIFGPHLRQVGNVGRHRGYFARTLPETSRRPVYFAPTVATAAAAAGILPLVRSRRLRRAGAVAVAGAWVGIAADALYEGKGVAVAAVLPAVIAASPGAYGLQFARGFVTRSIDEM
jgi:glycosyltransferase involved in cell wall biosynthesis